MCSIVPFYGRKAMPLIENQIDGFNRIVSVTSTLIEPFCRRQQLLLKHTFMSISSLAHRTQR